jgi:hypothetical protein
MNTGLIRLWLGRALGWHPTHSLIPLRYSEWFTPEKEADGQEKSAGNNTRNNPTFRNPGQRKALICHLLILSTPLNSFIAQNPTRVNEIRKPIYQARGMLME